MPQNKDPLIIIAQSLAMKFAWVNIGKFDGQIMYCMLPWQNSSLYVNFAIIVFCYGECIYNFNFILSQSFMWVIEMFFLATYVKMCKI